MYTVVNTLLLVYTRVHRYIIMHMLYCTIMYNMELEFPGSEEIIWTQTMERI